MTPAQLRLLFLQERRRFAKALPHVAKAGLALSDKHPRGSRRAPRDYAWTDGRRVYLTADALSLPRSNLVGLIRHELGHVAHPSGSEQAADDTAHAITGRRIRYDRRGVQTIGRGRWPRPKTLPR